MLASCKQIKLKFKIIWNAKLKLHLRIISNFFISVLDKREAIKEVITQV
jgi:hypothetical protein